MREDSIRVAEQLEAALDSGGYEGLQLEIGAIKSRITNAGRQIGLTPDESVMAAETGLKVLHWLFRLETWSGRNRQVRMPDTAAGAALSALDYLQNALDGYSGMQSFRNRRAGLIQALVDVALDVDGAPDHHRDFYSELGRKVAVAVLEHREFQHADQPPMFAPLPRYYDDIITTAIEQMVYFVGAGASGPIKIGIAADPAARLSTLQTGHYERLEMLALTGGGRAVELEYHRRFAQHRLAGEWFKRAPEIEAEIARLSPARA